MNANTKWPDGPWTASDQRVIAANGDVLLTVPFVSRKQAPFNRDVADSIVRLSAAAPALYESIKLRHAYEAVPADRGGSHGPKGQARTKWLAAEAAALAAVEGRT